MMQTYTHYKDSGIDWIGKIPEHWEQVPNKFIFNLKKNQVGKRSSEYDLLSLTLRGIIKRDMENPEGKFPAEFDSYQEVKINDFVFCLFDVEETPRTVGLSNYDGMITGAYTVMEPIGNNFAPFLYYYYLNADDKKQLKFLYRGLRNTIPKDSFFSLKTAIPPIQEQEAIAKFLDDKTAKIDALVHTKEQQIEKLKELRQAKIHQAVTKGLDANAPTKDSGVEWIGEIPAHWEVKSITKYSIRVDYRGKTPEKVDEGIFLITTRNIKNGKIDYNISKEFVSEDQYLEIMSRGIPKIGDILFTMEAPLGHSAIVDNENVAIAQRIIKFRFDSNFYNNFFVNYSFASNYFQSKVLCEGTGSTALGIKASKLGKLLLVTPPVQEQEQIVAYLDEVTGKIDQAITQKQEQITKLKEYKQSLINDVVTGKVKVC